VASYGAAALVLRTSPGCCLCKMFLVPLLPCSLLPAPCSLFAAASVAQVCGYSRSCRHMKAPVVLQPASAQPQALAEARVLAYAWLALASTHSSGCCRSFGSGSGGEVASG
jgi:hypothetical protein